LGKIVPDPFDMLKHVQPGEEGKHHLGGQHNGFDAFKLMNIQLRTVEGSFMPGEQSMLKG
jgi:hypothetical protein